MDFDKLQEKVAKLEKSAPGVKKGEAAAMKEFALGLKEVLVSFLKDRKEQIRPGQIFKDAAAKSLVPGDIAARGDALLVRWSGSVTPQDPQAIKDDAARLSASRKSLAASVFVRGSAITGFRWKDHALFDADGPGTSDLDVTLVGEPAIGLFKLTGFFVPGVHSRPVSEEDPDIAPTLVPLRERLMAMVRRPVNIQASREIVIQFRGDLLDQPYLVLCHKPDKA